MRQHREYRLLYFFASQAAEKEKEINELASQGFVIESNALAVGGSAYSIASVCLITMVRDAVESDESSDLEEKEKTDVTK